MDNRTYNISGINGENVQIGDNGKIESFKIEVSNERIEELFKALYVEISKTSNFKDEQIAKELEIGVKDRKWDTSKILFGLLSETVQASAAGIAIAQVFGWI
ncbi:hypothetical protein PA598K_00175 [Paenibacillus sp. 598K]|uniref:hypothetical protein n=1 Tax=Paenibacillus sp. 598K TaxID=1117987 RepID=UPI000FF9BF58|nr:hypothetical protein [Paenibacillus sp. 598K]GBF71947.1 hypothetical protein PA598K_00175 [Paenibacillus sp. 598K]